MIEVLPMPASEAYSWMLLRHYAKRKCPISFAFGAYRDGALIGVVTYGTPSSAPLRNGICGPEFSGMVLEWKWETAEKWAKDFKRAHLLRCNSPAKLPLLDKWGYESCDGTGWLRDRIKAGKLEEYLREPRARTSMPLAPHACRGEIRSRIQLDGSFKGSFQFRAE